MDNNDLDQGAGEEVKARDFFHKIPFFPQNTIFYLYLIVSLNHADDAEEGHSEIQ